MGAPLGNEAAGGEAGAGRHCSIGFVQGRLAVLLGGAVIAGSVAYRFLVRRPAPPAAPEPHVEELKSKLAESRVVAEDREEFEAAETPVDQAEPIPPDLGDRRASIHARGREAAEQMRRGSTGL